MRGGSHLEDREPRPPDADDGGRGAGANDLYREVIGRDARVGVGGGNVNEGRHVERELVPPGGGLAHPRGPEQLAVDAEVEGALVEAYDE